MKKIVAVSILTLCIVSILGCSTSRQIVKPIYIDKPVPALPPEPEFVKIDMSCINGNRVLTDDQLKALIVNIEMLKSAYYDLRIILQSLGGNDGMLKTEAERKVK